MEECIGKYLVINGESVLCREPGIQIDEKRKSIYEVLRVMKGVPLFIEDHLERLFNSANITGYLILTDKKIISKQVNFLISLNKIYDGNIKIILAGDEKSAKFTEIYCFFIKHRYPNTHDYQDGVSASLFSAVRHQPHAKLSNYSLREKVDRYMHEHGFYELIYYDDHEIITEGSRSNIFFIQNGIVVTPHKNMVLEGITRKYVIEVCEKLNIPFKEMVINKNEPANFDSCFLSGTSPKILPIRNIDDFNFDPDNPLLRRIMQEYETIVENYVNKNLNNINPLKLKL